MELYKSRTLDELGRISIPSDLRKELSLNPGDKISLTTISTITVLEKVEGATEADGTICEVSELGVITLPAELRQQRGWKEKDKVALYHTDNLMILKSDTRK